jgi:biopolymer transport protein ExbB
MSALAILLQATDLNATNTAQTGAGVDKLTEEIPVFELVMDGGWTMIPLFILSILTIYVFVERLLSINKALKDEKDFMGKVKDYLLDGKVDMARELCARTNNPAARMVEKGISRIGKPMRDIVSSIENVGKLEVYQLEKRLTLLATAAGVAPPLGRFYISLVVYDIDEQELLLKDTPDVDYKQFGPHVNFHNGRIPK